jgi:hypothetical protein
VRVSNFQGYELVSSYLHVLQGILLQANLWATMMDEDRMTLVSEWTDSFERFW